MNILWLILSVAIWGIVHSWLASLQAKDLAHRWFGKTADRLYRFAYNIFAVVSFLPTLALVYVLPDRMLYTIPAPWLFIAIVLQGVAALVLVIGVLQTDALAFIGIKQLVGLEENGQLVIKGLYRYVRHPLYTAGLVFIWFSPAMTVNRLVLYVAASLYILIGAYFEERKLARVFGQAYCEYMFSTPMLVPGLKWGNTARIESVCKEQKSL